MACTNPRIRIEDLSKWTKAQDGHLYHPFKVDWLNKYEQESLDEIRKTPYTKMQIIPCGNCIECKLNTARDKANQGYLESLYYQDNYMITLTIDDDHLIIPEEVITKDEISFTAQEDWNGHLIKSSVQNFMKRLREYFREEKSHTGIRHMLCGEYGELNGRPHYHIIVFNAPFPLDSFYDPKTKRGNEYFRNEIIEEKWEFGISNITACSWNTINYVARYITKKIHGATSEEYYASKGQTPEFTMQSNRPGLGYQYYEDHKEEIYKNDKILIKNKKGSHYVNPPRYFDELYKRENPEHFKEIQEKRLRNGINKSKEQDLQISYSRMEQNEVRNRAVIARTTALKRNNIEY